MLLLFVMNLMDKNTNLQFGIQKGKWNLIQFQILSLKAKMLLHLYLIQLMKIFYQA